MAGRRHRLVSTRKEAGFSQERLAEVLGVERSTVMRWECGETSPQPWARPKLARALGISDQLLSKLLDESADFHTQPEVPITAYADELLGLLNTPMSDRDRIALNTTVVGVHAQAQCR